MKRRVVLLTGGSVGLGLAIARLLIKERERDALHVVLTARLSSLHRFEEQGITEQEGVWIRPLDVTDAQQRQAVVDEIAAVLDGVDVLINNAGVA
jgi:NAD(P)-dependent dehydrogenase (short-subunit alcohol dehydrogenase family)